MAVRPASRCSIYNYARRRYAGSSLISIPLDTVDNEGLVYYLGTSFGTTAFSSPYGGLTIVTANTTDHPETEGPQHLVDRTSTGWVSQSGGGQHFTIELDYGANAMTFHLSDIRIRQRTNFTSELFRSLEVFGSNNGTDWTSLDTASFTGAMGEWETWSGIDDTAAWKYFRVAQVGNNSSGSGWFCVAEVELFGILVL